MPRRRAPARSRPRGGLDALRECPVGYAVEIPPGFSAIREAENGDGGTASSPAGHAALSVWGTNLLDASFAAEVESRISDASAEGWAIGYRAVSRTSASWSGTRGGRVLYVRAIPRCRDQAAFARIEYDALAKSAFDPLVSRLAHRLRAGGGC